MAKKDKELKTPRVGDRVVTIDLYQGVGRKGVRLNVFSDPAKKLAWVKFDDGEVEGVYLKSLVKEKDYPRTLAYKILKND